MSYQLMLEVEATLDIREAFLWYEEQKDGLGFYFVQELERCYNKISTNPLYYTKINNHFRKIRVNKFPYLLIYEIEGNKIFINAVRHMSRKEKY